MSNDLDSAIIDELKCQLQLHEERQSKTEELLQQHALEKEKLTKRIDVLTAGNDRMAELKERQDMDVQMYQARIRELQEKLQQLESWGEEGTANVAPSIASSSAPVPQPPNEEALAKIENLQAENQDLNTECQELQSQLQQEKRLAQELQAQAEHERQQLQEIQQQKLQAEQQCHQLQQQLLEQLQQQQELQQEQQQLQEQLQEQEKLQEQLQQQLQEQLQQQQQLREQLQQQQLVEQPSTVVDTPPSDESLALLQEKESEIVHLKQRIEELMREDQTEKLVLEILTKNQELQLLRMQIKQLQEEEKQEKPAEVPDVHNNEAKQQVEQLQQQLKQVQQQCQQLEQEKNDMEEELRVLNNHVLSSLELEDKMKQTLLELDTKNIEVTELRKSLELLQQAQAQAQQPPPAEAPQPDLSALNKQWEALVEQKCSEVASIWQGHLQQREAAYEAQIAQLQQQQTTTTTATIATTTETVPVTETPPSDLVEKMQKALETQEMEIVTLKEQLAIRSAEYARLASQYDPFRLQNTLVGSGAASATPNTGSNQEGQPEYVLKSDLDYALMMLHQREMRIEEMIIELVQLLDERDHLQLKLSDTLRQLEAERSRGTLDDCKCPINVLKIHISIHLLLSCSWQHSRCTGKRFLLVNGLG